MKASFQIIWIFISGICIGWLSGLSVSPVLATVLSAVLAAICGVVVGVRSVDSTKSAAVDSAPLALLLLGIALAAPIGVMVRTHCLLEPGQECRSVDTNTQSKSGFQSAVSVGGLFGTRVRNDWCDEVLRESDHRLANALRQSTHDSKWAIEFISAIKEPQQLRRVLEAICTEP